MYNIHIYKLQMELNVNFDPITNDDQRKKRFKVTKVAAFDHYLQL